MNWNLERKNLRNQLRRTQAYYPRKLRDHTVLGQYHYERSSRGS